MQQKISSLLSFFQHPQLSANSTIYIDIYALKSQQKNKTPRNQKNSLRMFKTKKPNPIFIGLLFLFLVMVSCIGLKNTTWVCFIRQREIKINNVDYHHHVYRYISKTNPEDL